MRSPGVFDVAEHGVLQPRDLVLGTLGALGRRDCERLGTGHGHDLVTTAAAGQAQVADHRAADAGGRRDSVSSAPWSELGDVVDEDAHEVIDTLFNPVIGIS
jgi:hypothetical protein